MLISNQYIIVEPIIIKATITFYPSFILSRLKTQQHFCRLRWDKGPTPNGSANLFQMFGTTQVTFKVFFLKKTADGSDRRKTEQNNSIQYWSRKMSGHEFSFITNQLKNVPTKRFVILANNTGTGNTNWQMAVQVKLSTQHFFHCLMMISWNPLLEWIQ